jgi:esterase/lipase superfamily enzyme
MPPHLKAELLARYDRYIVDEVLPLIRNENPPEYAKPVTTGASLGAYLAANEYFKHPDLFRGTIPMSGSYDVRSFLDGYYDDNVYFNTRWIILPNLEREYHLPILQQADSIYILSGQGSYEDPERSRQLSSILKSKDIPHNLELWGADVNHDWPWWRKMLPHVLGKIIQG